MANTVLYNFLLNSGLSYCFAACKGTLFLADQKEYVQTNARNTIAIIQTALQVLLLLLFRAYLSYLLIQLAGTLCVNAYVAHLAEKRYPEIFKLQHHQQIEPRGAGLSGDLGQALPVFEVRYRGHRGSASGDLTVR